MLLPYETVFSRTRGRVNDPKELSLSENDLLDIYTERLHNVIGNREFVDSSLLSHLMMKSNRLTLL